jgi:hypothetical protein
MPAQNDHLEISSGRSCDQQGSVEKAAVTKRRGRPPKSKEEKYRPTHIFFHPKVIEWAKAEAEKRGVGYQSVINETLLQHVGS